MKKVTMIRRFWSYLLLILSLTWLGFPATSQAQEIGLTVSPPVNYLQVRPGESITQAITITQTGTSSLTVTPKLVQLEVDSKTGAARPGQSIELVYVSSSGQIQLNQPFQLEPDASRQVVLKISPPADIRPQELHLMLIFETTRPNQGQSTQTSISAGAASNLIVLISNSEANQADFQLKKIDLPIFLDSFQDIPIKAEIANMGPTASALSGQVTVTNIWGNQIATIPIYPDVILANTSRPVRGLIEISAEETIIPEAIALKTNTFFLIGPYQVVLTAKPAANPAAEPVISTTTVWAIPWKIGLGLTLVVLIWAIIKSSGKVLIVKPPQTN